MRVPDVRERTTGPICGLGLSGRGRRRKKRKREEKKDELELAETAQERMQPEAL